MYLIKNHLRMNNKAVNQGAAKKLKTKCENVLLLTPGRQMILFRNSKSVLV